MVLPRCIFSLTPQASSWQVHSQLWPLPQLLCQGLLMFSQRFRRSLGSGSVRLNWAQGHQKKYEVLLTFFGLISHHLRLWNKWLHQLPFQPNVLEGAPKTCWRLARYRGGMLIRNSSRTDQTLDLIACVPQFSRKRSQAQIRQPSPHVAMAGCSHPATSF